MKKWALCFTYKDHALLQFRFIGFLLFTIFICAKFEASLGNIIIFITQEALSWYNMIASFVHASFIMVCNQYVTAETTLDHCDKTHYVGKA